MDLANKTVCWQPTKAYPEPTTKLHRHSSPNCQFQNYKSSVGGIVVSIAAFQNYKSRRENVPSPSLFFLPFGKPILQNPCEEIAIGVHAV